MTLTFLGTGTSTGVPMVGCSCAVCRSDDAHNRRRRSSVLLQDGERAWLIDAGPDFRQQALSVGLQRLDAVFLTHSHADHILGLDDLRPLSWKNELPVWGDEPTLHAVQTAFPYMVGPGDGKTSRPRLQFRLLPEGRATLAGLSVRPIRIQHGDRFIWGFRIGSLAYLTDCNGIPDDSLDALRGVETLVLGALRHTPHPTHFTIAEAVAAARLVGASQTWLTHLSHDVDHATLAASLPVGVAPAYDGLVLSFRA